MSIDIVYILILVLAVVKGFRNGLIYAIFSFAAFFIGLAAALKLSAIVANRIAGDEEPSKWLPLISFFIVFVVVAMIVGFAGKIFQKTFEVAMLGWLNRLTGAILYVLIYSLIFSVILFYLNELNFISPETSENSFFYEYLQPLAPWIIDGLGSIIPYFKDIFTDLQEFFHGISNKMQH